jgi:hypothetical protein
MLALVRQSQASRLTWPIIEMSNSLNEANGNQVATQTEASDSAVNAGRRSLAPRVAELLSDRSADALPVWVRAPRAGGVEHYTGLGRSKLYELATTGRVRSVSLRDNGSVKGVRLFCLSSILNFIAKCETETAGASEQGER